MKKRGCDIAVLTRGGRWSNIFIVLRCGDGTLTWVKTWVQAVFTVFFAAGTERERNVIVMLCNDWVRTHIIISAPHICPYITSLAQYSSVTFYLATIPPPANVENVSIFSVGRYMIDGRTETQIQNTEWIHNGKLKYLSVIRIIVIPELPQH